MSRHLFALACGAVFACAAAAQEPKKSPTALPKGEAAKRSAEEVEQIEAHLQTKKAYIQAAKVALEAARAGLERARNAGPAAIRQAVEDAEFGVKAAEAHYMIREAEANEVAVKLKHARRRAEDARTAAAALDPKVRASREKIVLSLEVAKGESKIAEDEVARLEGLVRKGFVPQSELNVAREKRRIADLRVQQIEKELAEIEKATPERKK